MKKFLFTFLFSLVAIIGNAQIYNTIKYVDKFDDVIRKETIKSKITVHELDSADWFGIEDLKDLSAIEIETKGNEHIKYFSIGKTSFGDENNIEEITNGLYGYQTHYFCVNPYWVLNEVEKIDSLINLKCDSMRIAGFNEEDILLYKDRMTYNKMGQFLLKLRIHFLNCILDKEKLNENEFILVDRTITTQYSGTFLDRLFWIKLADGSRFIYTNTRQ